MATEESEDAYGRVTNAERFLILHTAARELIDRLCAEHRPQRIDGTDLDPECARVCPGSPATTLAPARGALLTLTLTPFPGVRVRYGFAGTAMFPSCGCDACDEDPDAEAQRMAELVADVTSGHLSETRKRRILRSDSYESVLTTEGRTTRIVSSIVDPETAGSLPVGTTRWPPWAATPESRE